MSTLTKVSTLTTLECGSCHIPFAMPTSMHENAVRTGSWFWCPNGHKIHYREKNRIAAGVCPCCTRSFQNLQRHMAGQHPDFVKGPES